jgi:hypothetical protein
VRRVYKGEDCLKEEEREGIIKILMNWMREIINKHALQSMANAFIRRINW